MVHQLLVDFKKAYDSVRRDVLYNNFIELGVLMELVRLIKIHSDETCTKVCIGKRLSNTECSLCRLVRLLAGLSVCCLRTQRGSPRQTVGHSFGDNLITESLNVAPSSVTEAYLYGALCEIQFRTKSFHL
jgi:hypothetical protein